VIPVTPWITGLEAAMMGRQCGDQTSLFCEFRLEDRIPKDYLLRRINVFVCSNYQVSIAEIVNKVSDAAYRQMTSASQRQCRSPMMMKRGQGGGLVSGEDRSVLITNADVVLVHIASEYW
jgi:hypothetical protein